MKRMKNVLFLKEGKIYSGTYERVQKTLKGTEYYDGSEISTLPINIDGFSG